MDLPATLEQPEISMRSLGLLHAVSSGLLGVRQTMRRVAMAAAAACLLAVPLSHAADVATDAASEGAVKVKLTQARVDMQEGKEKLVEVESVKPGDVIEYRAVYTNTSKETVRELTATLPLPDGLDYLAKSAKASEGLPLVQVVARDGQSGTEPLMVTQAGKKVEMPASQYRVLRWRVGSMVAGRSVTVSARARVSMLPIAPRAAAEPAPKR